MGAKFSSEILDLNLDFIRFTAANVDSHTQVAQIHLKNFLGTELIVSRFKFKVKCNLKYISLIRLNFKWTTATSSY